MKRILTMAAIVIALLGLVATEASAKRMGSGRTMGKQQSAIVERDATPSAPSTPARAAPNAANTGAVPGQVAGSGSSRWLGPVAGIAAGLGIAALLGYIGLSEPVAAILGNLIVVALVVMVLMMIWRALRSRGTPTRMQPAYAQRALSPETVSTLGREGMVYPQPSAPLRLEATVHPGAGLRPISAPSRFGIPEGFDITAFVRNAKVYFVRLQAAWDAGDMADIREFTTAQMCEEIGRQLEERGATPNRTDVVTLDAEVLGVTSTADEHMASVRFHGMLRENVDGPAESFDEVWNLTKPVAGNGGWVLAGIQQIQTESPYQVYV